MQQVLGYSAIKAGLSYLPLALTIIAASAIASQLVTRIGFKPVLAAGMAFIAGGLVWFSQVSVDGGFATDILGPSLLAAAGLGFGFVTTTIAAVSGVREQESGLAGRPGSTPRSRSGARSGSRCWRRSQLANGRPHCERRRRSRRAPERAHGGIPGRVLGGAAIAALGLVLTLVLIRTRDSRAHVELGAPQEQPTEA